ncbi:MAG TPA: DNA polymerase I [Nitrospiria bacterium]|nr:DNA polymerase I [Nitrospiria bacterium]
MPPARASASPHATPVALYLIDGHSLLYRAYYAIRHLSSPAGTPTNAVYGMTTMLLKVLRERQPAYVAIAFDTKAPTLRHQAYKDYKAHRPPMPNELSAQLPYVTRLIDALRIPRLSLEGYEADDLIATMAVKAAAGGLPVVIVSTDKDLYQLITPSITLYDAMKDQLIGPAEVAARFGVEPARMVDLLGLMGDPVDNVPGVPGVGEKTAAALIQQFGSIEGLFEHLEEVGKTKLRETLRSHTDQARLSRELVRLHTDCPIPFDPERFRLAMPDSAQLRALFTELGFSSLLDALPSAEAGSASGTVPPPSIETDPATLWPALGRAPLAAVAMHHEPEAPRPAGLSINLEDDAVYYLPWGEPMRTFAERLRSGGGTVAGHHLKPLLHAFADLEVDAPAVGFDTLIASYLLDPTRSQDDLGAVASSHSIDPGPLQAWPDGREQSAAASLIIRTLIPRLRVELDRYELRPLFEEVELPLIEVLASMERRGVLLDIEALAAVGRELRGHLERLETRIYQLAGERFNLNSPKQLSDVLFNKLGLPPVKKTKTGLSTDESVLTQLALQHELPADLISYRQLNKLLTTYVDALPALINPATGRLHTTFHQAVTATGRLSSSDPNLQNIPIRGEWGTRIRSCFIAAPGCRLLSADYNQIELRLLAHFSQDPALIDAFTAGEDVHAATGSQIFGRPPADITPAMRRIAKTVNFAVIYGMSPFGLSQELGISQGEARQYIDRYFAHYRGVKHFIDQTVARASADGVVTTLWKRRRPIPELAQRPAATRALGERTAVNTVVQGSAADLIKVAMNRVWRRLRRERRRSALLLQIHDELVLEVPDAELESVRALVIEEMEGAAELSVPLRVDPGAGRHWAEAH